MKKILIIEDNAGIRELLRMTLEFDGFNIHEAANGDTGLQMARQIAPDTILLDVKMPGALSGLEVCRCIKADPALRHAKVIMLTANGRAEDRRDGLNAGADDYILKPFSTLHVLETVCRAPA